MCLDIMAFNRLLGRSISYQIYNTNQDKINNKSGHPRSGGLDKFWSDYAAVAAKQGVPKSGIKWYVSWAKDFAKSLRGPTPSPPAWSAGGGVS